MGYVVRRLANLSGPHSLAQLFFLRYSDHVRDYGSSEKRLVDVCRIFVSTMLLHWHAWKLVLGQGHGEEKLGQYQIFSATAPCLQVFVIIINHCGSLARYGLVELGLWCDSATRSIYCRQYCSWQRIRGFFYENVLCKFTFDID